LNTDLFPQLAPPPRGLTIPLICKALLGRTGRMGAMFICCCALFFVVGLDVRHAEELQLAIYSTTARGTVTGAQTTNTSVGDVPVWRYEFAFRAQDGQDYVGRSYSTGPLQLDGSRVLIEYVPERPMASRIQGTRLSSPPYWAVALLFAFPLLGAGLVVNAAARGVRQIRLLRYGALTKGRLLYAEPMRLKVDGVNIAKYEYEFLADDGVVYYDSTMAPASCFVGDEPEEAVLYDAADPGQSMLVDSLKWGHTLKVDEHGKWTTRGGWRAMAWCALAGGATAAFTAYLLVNLASLV
jgi:hypothetical protein